MGRPGESVRHLYSEQRTPSGHRGLACKGCGKFVSQVASRLRTHATECDQLRVKGYHIGKAEKNHPGLPP